MTQDQIIKLDQIFKTYPQFRDDFNTLRYLTLTRNYDQLKAELDNTNEINERDYTYFNFNFKDRIFGTILDTASGQGVLADELWFSSQGTSVPPILILRFTEDHQAIDGYTFDPQGIQW